MKLKYLISETDTPEIFKGDVILVMGNKIVGVIASPSEEFIDRINKKKKKKPKADPAPVVNTYTAPVPPNADCHMSLEWTLAMLNSSHNMPVGDTTMLVTAAMGGVDAETCEERNRRNIPMDSTTMTAIFAKTGYVKQFDTTTRTAQCMYAQVKKGSNLVARIKKDRSTGNGCQFDYHLTSAGRARVRKLKETLNEAAIVGQA